MTKYEAFQAKLDRCVTMANEATDPRMKKFWTNAAIGTKAQFERWKEKTFIDPENTRG